MMRPHEQPRTSIRWHCYTDLDRLRMLAKRKHCSPKRREKLLRRIVGAIVKRSQNG